MNLEGDSADYELLTEGVWLSRNVQGMTAEIGLRRGGGSKYIIDALHQFCSPGSVHIAIDPYGNIEYEHKEGDRVRLDYTNKMLSECMSNIYAYAESKGVQFIFFNLEDIEFFNRYADGVPVYNQVKQVVNKYKFVHFDGPHALVPLIEEIQFFWPRTERGACWVFDDVEGYYNHDEIETKLFPYGFKLIRKTAKKALYQYEG